MVWEKNNYFNNAKQHAKMKGGECLSDEYVNVKTKMEWKCNKPGHPVWYSPYSKVIYGDHWCRQCAAEKRGINNTIKNALEIAQSYAKNKGGECLSKEYIGTKEKLIWKCHNEKHKSWQATYSNIVKHNRWCPECGFERIALKSKNKEGLKNAYNYAKSRGGICLSKEYVSSKNKLEWKCNNSEHPSWFGTYSNTVSRKLWCRKCSFLEKSLKLKDPNGLKVAQEYAKRKNGVCLSKEYNGALRKLEWKCNDKSHPSWFATHAAVTKADSWCPKCGEKKNVQEYRVRNILEYLLEAKFIKRRDLEWNKNSKTGRKLELDGYNEELKIAFEFQGRQHFEDFFGINSLEGTQFRDREKTKNCAVNKIKLIILKEHHRSKFETVMQEIYDQLDKLEIKINKQINREELLEIYYKSENNNVQKEFLKKAKEYAKNKDGECLSLEYINVKEKLLWKCNSEDHPAWLASYNEMIHTNHKKWCRHCTLETLKYDGLSIVQRENKLKQCISIARDRGGECLSTEFVNIRKNMEWKCSNSRHSSWFSTYRNVIEKNRWCRLCRGGISKGNSSDVKNTYFKHAQSYAESRGGKCLSLEYILSKTLMEWKCSNLNHCSWFANYNNVVTKKKWCRQSYLESYKSKYKKKIK